MSRLQVGGLALVISDALVRENEGKIVKIIRYIPDASYDNGYGVLSASDVFEVSCESGIKMFSDGSTRYNGGVGYERKCLLPLGDQKTQDELQKEELENA